MREVFVTGPKPASLITLRAARSTCAIGSPGRAVFNIRAAEQAIREINAQYITAILEGRYTDRYLRDLGSDAPHFTPEEMKIIGSPLDFLGVNIYTARRPCPPTSLKVSR